MAGGNLLCPPMAQRLWLLRHGEAEPHEAREDFDRRLTARGEGQARAAGGAFAVLGLEWDRVLTSPKVRALDTARLACEASGAGFDVHEPLAEDFTAEQAVELLAGCRDGARVLLVGHEPDLSEITAALTSARVKLRKGAAVALKLKPGVAELHALLQPGQLAAIASAR